MLSPFRKQLSTFSAMIDNPMLPISKSKSFSSTKITTLLLYATAFMFDQIVEICGTSDSDDDLFNSLRGQGG